MVKLASLRLIEEEPKQEIIKKTVEEPEIKAPKEKELVLEYLRHDLADYDKETEEF